MRYFYNLILILTGIAFSYSCPAQVPEIQDCANTCNMYLVGDKISHVTMNNPTFVYKQGTEQLWDMRNMQVNKVIKTTYYTPSDSTLRNYTAKLENSTSRYYKLIANKILYFGLDNHTTTLRYNNPEYIQYGKVSFGQQLDGHFVGNGVYAEKDSFQIWGDYHTEVKAKGTLLTPDGDTWENILLQHTNRNLIIQKNSNDSICLYIIENKWFVPYYRYPIIVNKQIRNKTRNSIQEETYYTPYLKESYSSPMNAKLQESNNDNYTEEEKQVYNISKKDLLINQGEGMLEIIFYNNKEQKISYGIYTNEGITIYYQNERLTKKGFISKNIKAKLQKNRIYLFTVTKGENKQTYKFKAK